MSTFKLRWPNKDPRSRMHERELPTHQSKTLQVLFREMKLIGTRLRCRMYRQNDMTPLRLSYVPRPGDVILLTPGMP